MSLHYNEIKFFIWKGNKIKELLETKLAQHLAIKTLQGD